MPPVSTAAERERNRKMILSPYEWPHMFLPLKRPIDGSNEIATLRTASNEIATLRTAVTQETYKWAMTHGQPVKFHVDKNLTIYGSSIDPVEHLVYDDVDALLDDGWIVD